MCSSTLPEMPVMLVPGCARLFTKPSSTGSSEAAITMGIVCVAFCSIFVVRAEAESTRSGGSLTSSRTNACSRSSWPAAEVQRYSMLRPSS
jgi:hypothetical protein